MTQNDIIPPVAEDDASHTYHADRVGDMSPRDFAQLGMNHFAYIRALGADRDGAGWAIHAADGEQIGLAPTHDLAFAATRQHDMVPLSVH